ncbi:MAG: acyl-ACP--UDP-N-acetylglucosamine O-acyltransferase [Gammaproteobacteria bacterium]|nr:acyl-ACP--UDP-N-acetylglucosamine O-acyltransferase [Gammaproteobacteria bacterium]
MSAIHPTAIVSPDANIGEGVSIAPYAIVEANVSIGDGCMIGSHSVIKEFTRLGKNNTVHEHVVLGGTPQDFKFSRCESFVNIGEGNVFREAVTVHRSNSTGKHTVIGNNNYLMANAHVAHDCILGDNIIMANGVLLGGHVVIEDRAFLSGVVTVHQFCRIGTMAMLGASTRINQDCLPYMIIDGAPGRVRGLNLVGLKRAGLSSDEIRDLKRAMYALFGSGNLMEKLAGFKSSPSKQVQHLARFIEASERGFTHKHRR